MAPTNSKVSDTLTLPRGGTHLRVCDHCCASSCCCGDGGGGGGGGDGGGLVVVLLKWKLASDILGGSGGRARRFISIQCQNGDLQLN